MFRWGLGRKESAFRKPGAIKSKSLSGTPLTKSLYIITFPNICVDWEDPVGLQYGEANIWGPGPSRELLQVWVNNFQDPPFGLGWFQEPPNNVYPRFNPYPQSHPRTVSPFCPLLVRVTRSCSESSVRVWAFQLFTRSTNNVKQENL